MSRVDFKYKDDKYTYLSGFHGKSWGISLTNFILGCVSRTERQGSDSIGVAGR